MAPLRGRGGGLHERTFPEVAKHGEESQILLEEHLVIWSVELLLR